MGKKTPYTNESFQDRRAETDKTALPCEPSELFGYLLETFPLFHRPTQGGAESSCQELFFLREEIQDCEKSKPRE
jgi:hypothetical protein